MRTMAAGLATLVSGLVLVGCGEQAPTDGDPDADGKVAAPQDAPATRTESYGGVEVTVPAHWGWGAAPSGDASDPGIAWCTDGQVRRPDGSVGWQETPYVGRPDVLSDACTQWDPADPPRPGAAYVWLGVPVEPGVRTIGEWVVETRRVGGVPVTVASDDPAERAAVLDSARAVDEDAHGCTTRPRGTGGLSREGLGEVHGMSVCLYRPRLRDTPVLYASDEVGPDRARRFAEAVYDGGTAPVDALNCPDGLFETVELVVHSDDDFGGPGALQHPVFTVHPSCPALDDPLVVGRPLESETVRPWLTPVVQAHLAVGDLEGPVDGWFRNPMG